LARTIYIHISRDGTTIEAREKAAKKMEAPETAPAVAKKRGRPRKNEARDGLTAQLTQLPPKTYLPSNHCSQRAACLLMASRRADSSVSAPWEMNFSIHASSRKPRTTSTPARIRRR